MLRLLISYAVLLMMLQACNEGPIVASSTKQPDVVETTTVYLNGDIVTIDESQPMVEAVAVQDGLIIAMGTQSEVLSAMGSSVEIQDLEGKTLLPSFIDAHGHISFTAAVQASANVSSPPVGIANTIEDVIDLLKQQRDKTPSDSWIVGWGYDDSLLAEKRHATREDLDQVSTTRPVAIQHVSGHFLSCNSVCLALAGISAETDNPAGGIIRRRPDGAEPDGVLEESAVMPVYAVLPRPDRVTRLELLKAAQNYYASYGITTVQDGAASIEDIELLREAASQNLLKLDIVAYPHAHNLGDRLSEFAPSKEYLDRFRVGGFKLILDGSPQGKTAWLTKPYFHPPHGQGENYAGYQSLTDRQVEEYIELAFGNKIQVIAHANGDAAADQLINAIATANSNHGLADRRSVMIHAQTVRDDQLDLMLEHEIMPSYFSAHTFYWGDWHRDSVFGVERASRISPLRSSSDRGLRYTTHNDTPIVPPDMARLVWASVNRITRSGKVLGEDQRATVMQALKSITIDAAFQYFEEDSKGSISLGKIADLVVLDQNPLKIEASEIKDIQVLQTIKGGVTIFSKKNSDKESGEQ